MSTIVTATNKKKTSLTAGKTTFSLDSAAVRMRTKRTKHDEMLIPIGGHPLTKFKSLQLSHRDLSLESYSRCVRISGRVCDVCERAVSLERWWHGDWHSRAHLESQLISTGYFCSRLRKVLRKLCHPKTARANLSTSYASSRIQNRDTRNIRNHRGSVSQI
eukprot:SAG31_NODE_341_length_17459_cov_29.188123_5_plen_161_part_00